MKNKYILIVFMFLLLGVTLYFPYDKVMDPKNIQCAPQTTYLKLEKFGNFLEKIGNPSLNSAILEKYKYCRSSGQYFSIMGWEIQQYKVGNVKYARYILSEAMLGLYVTPEEKRYVVNNCVDFLKNAKKYDPKLSGMEYMWAGDIVPVYEKRLSLHELKNIDVADVGGPKKIYFQYIYNYLDSSSERYVENQCRKMLFLQG